MDKPRLLIAVTSPMSSMFYQGQLAWLQAQGFDVHFLCGPSEQARTVVESQGATYHPITMERAIAPWADVRSLLQIIRLLVRVQPTIINTGTPKAGLLVMIAAALVGVKARIYTIHGLRLETTTGLKRKLFSLIEWFVCTLATEVFCVSRTLRTRVAELGICPFAKIVVPASGSVNGIDTQELNPAKWVAAGRELRSNHSIPQDAIVIGFVGRFVRDKGFHELTRVWQWLREHYPTIHLLMVGDLEIGDRPDSSDYEFLQTDPRVHWTGFLSNVAPCYAAMDILLFPSYREGLSVTLLEAASMGVPCVASDIPGCRDAVLANKTGFLVTVHDEGGLKAAVERYVTSPSLRQLHGETARQHIQKRFERARLWQALSELFREIVSRRT